MVGWKKGMKHKPETKEKIRAWHLAHPYNPIAGKKHTSEAKQKISLANKGKTGEFSEEGLKRLRDLHLGKKLSEETKRKMSEARRGDKNGRWKGNNVTKISARRRARQLFPCAKGLHHHHIDGNVYNNSSENIEILTPKEHSQKHKRGGTQ